MAEGQSNPVKGQSQLDRAASRGLLWFGVSIGLLTALNVTAGATAALIGLLFAFVGGSLLTLYQGADRLPAEQRGLLFTQAGQVSKGLILGLLVGIGLRFFDNTLLQSGSTSVQSRVEPGSALTDPGKSPALPTSRVSLHAEFVSATQTVIDRCEALATATNNQLTPQDRDALKRLATDLKGELDIAEALSDVRQLARSNRLGPAAQNTLRTELDAAFQPRSAEP